MIHVTVAFRDHVVGHFDVAGDRVRIGRLPDNDVVIDSQNISRNHCTIARGADGGWVVEDLRSNNGTFVNGARIARSPVKNGDVVLIGKFQVSFQWRADPADARAAAGKPRTQRIVPGPGMAELQAPLRGYLVFQNRAGAPVIVERDVTVFGAAAGADVPVDGPPRRAVLVRGYGGFTLVNAGPPGELRVDGVEVHDRAVIKNGARVAVGPLSFELHEGQLSGDESTMELNMKNFPPGLGSSPIV